MEVKMEVKMVVRILVTDGQTKDTSNCRVTFACEKIQGVPKRGGLRISALYVFYCATWAFRGLLNILGGSYIKIKYCQAILKAFHIFFTQF